MVESSAGEAQTRGNVLALQVGEFLENLVRRQPVRQQVEHIRHADAQAADAGTPSALGGVDGDAVGLDVTGGTSAYTHDANGQPAGDGVQAYQWNARHELIRVQCVNDALAWFVAPRTAWER